MAASGSSWAETRAPSCRRGAGDSHLSSGVLRPGCPVSDKYELIDGERYAYPIARMCDWLEVSRAGFYEWRHRPASATAQRRASLTERIRTVFAESRQTYG